MKQAFLLEVTNLTVQLSGKTLLNNVSFKINHGEFLAIVGPSGSGKSTLIKALAGNHPGRGIINFQIENGEAPQIAVISQQHQFKNLSNTNTFYYQQRFNSCDAEDALMVNDILESLSADEKMIQETLQMFDIEYLRYTRLIQLSNGEHKRFQLAKAILQNADWLLLDSPYTGLDVAARRLLNGVIDNLIAKGIHVFLVTSYVDIPASATHVAVLNDGELKQRMSRNEFRVPVRANESLRLLNSKPLESIPPVYKHVEFSVAIKMVDTSITYNGRKILDKINWKVNKGECWNVSGHNGSGKSTLLSLITGDNPQAFSNEIYLFDRKKGSGESIWDIKQKIGYVSPELHHYFDATCSCFEVVASGLFDTIGLFKKLNETQKSTVRNWMLLLHLEQFQNRLFKQLSNGEQRLVLLARALVKNPPLLILDEPCQGLDQHVSAWFIGLINEVCIRMKKTLVYVSHYEEEIPPCVTYTLKLEHGRIAA